MTLLQHIEDLVTGSSLNTKFQKVRYLITSLIALVIGLILLLNGIISSNNLNNSNVIIRNKNQQRILRIIEDRNSDNSILPAFNIQDYERQNQSDLKQKIEQEILQANFILLITIILLSYFSLYYLLKPLSDNINQRENFVARASHELRTPLAILYSELSLGESLTEVQPIQQILLESKDEVLRLQELSNNLLGQNYDQIRLNNQERGFSTNSDLINIIWKRLSKLEPELAQLEWIENDLNQLNWFLGKPNHKNLIEELFWNILDNTFKHGDLNQPVQIKVNNNQIIISNTIDSKDKKTNPKTHGLGICKDICKQLDWSFNSQTRDNLFIVEILI